MALGIMILIIEGRAAVREALVGAGLPSAPPHRSGYVVYVSVRRYRKTGRQRRWRTKG